MVMLRIDWMLYQVVVTILFPIVGQSQSMLISKWDISDCKPVYYIQLRVLPYYFSLLATIINFTIVSHFTLLL